MNAFLMCKTDKLKNAICNVQKGRISLSNRMNFWKRARGGGVIFDPKIYVADFENFKQGFFFFFCFANQLKEYWFVIYKHQMSNNGLPYFWTSSYERA